MRTVLRIGREPDNDFVINLPIVSGYHARVTWEGVPGRALIEDLGSSNGTAIGQLDRKVTRSALTASDTVYFGNHPVHAADLLAQVDPSMAPVLLLQGAEMVIGRDPGCHRVIERPTISGRHARLRRAGERIILEDLGSSNGTFVNGRAVDGPTEVQAGDLIGLGADSFRLATGQSTATTQRMTAAHLKPPTSARPAPTLQIDPGDVDAIGGAGASGGWIYPAALSALVLQAPVLALVIGLAPASVSTTLFAIGLASTWFGLSTAVFGLLFDPKLPEASQGPASPSFWPLRLLILGALVLVECVLAQLVVATLGDLKVGPGLPALRMLFLASGVGLALGFLIVLWTRSLTTAVATLAGVMVAFSLFGGGPWSLPRSVSPIRLASNASPSRWAFEGLLVSEADRRAYFDPARDQLEAYFPGDSDRMGPRADVIALGAMLVGLLGLVGGLVKTSGAGPKSP